MIPINPLASSKQELEKFYGKFTIFMKILSKESIVYTQQKLFAQTKSWIQNRFFSPVPTQQIKPPTVLP